jgi:hypothetical protein
METDVTEIVGGISQNQILAEIQKALEAMPQGGDGISCREIAEHLGVSVIKGRDIARRFLAEGKLTHAKIMRLNVHGHPVTQDGFKLPSKP